jgi:A/G-specific adenine glycosylase
MDKRYFSEKVAEWYDLNKRDLPWRATKDPYKIWLSEIILQQTRVAQGLPYYEKFISKFPDVRRLAAASEQEVLRLWQGLGYYTRARNLHKCARSVVSHFTGVFPKSYDELLTLPGIGEYTAAAIASFSNNERVAVVDGNVFRVISRVFGIDEEINSPAGRKTFSKIANDLITYAQPAKHNQAMMEFGALWCTPKSPRCTECVLLKGCAAAQNNIQHLLPVKAKSKKPKKRYFYYVVIKKGQSLMMRKRQGKDIWHGLFDFYLVEKDRNTRAQLVLEEVPGLKKKLHGSKVAISKLYRHVLSHQTIDARFITTTTDTVPVLNEPELKLYSKKKIADLPKPVLITRFLDDYNWQEE